MNPFIFVGAVVNSALYLMAVFAAGLVERNKAAEYLAVATFGVAYLGYVSQALEGAPSKRSAALVVASILLGALAGVALLV